MLAVGSQMPDFALRDTARQEVTAQDFAGQITVLAFFAMAFTGG